MLIQRCRAAQELESPTLRPDGPARLSQAQLAASVTRLYTEAATPRYPLPRRSHRALRAAAEAEAAPPGSSGAEPEPEPEPVCRGAWARVTMDQLRHRALQP